MDYHPYYGGTNPNHSKGSDSQTLAFLKDPDGWLNRTKEDLIRRISLWLREVLDIVIVIAPGHSPGPSQNFLYPIIEHLIGGNIKDGRDLLIRTEEVPKATKGGPRDQSLHEKTIQVTDPSRVKDKVVYIIDDIWTTGSTLRACASLMRKAGARDVKLLAVGKTVSM